MPGLRASPVREGEPLSEADDQAAHYKDDPEGVLKWFIDHPMEADEWSAEMWLRMKSRTNRLRNLLWTIAQLAILALWAAFLIFAISGGLR